MHRTRWIILIGALLTISARDAAAQAAPAAPAGQPGTSMDWLDRGYFNFNVGFETSSGDLNDTLTFSLYGEPGTKTVTQDVDSGALIDFAVGARVWRNVSAGIGYHRESNSNDASATASVPNPVFFANNRAVAITADDLQRVEQAFHIQVGYLIPLSDVLSVHVMAGPSFFSLSQDVVSDMTFTEQAFPFTNVNASPVVTERTDSAVGINAGVDVTYQFYNTGDYKIGAGAFLRYAGASAKIPVLQRETQTELGSDVGGLQLGFGARIRF
jgi:hypothetical protein